MPVSIYKIVFLSCEVSYDIYNIWYDIEYNILYI